MVRGALSLVTLATVTMSVAADPSLDSLKQTYEAEVKRIRDAHGARLSGLLNAYGKSLDKAIAGLKKEGDPDRVLAGMTERRRFDGDRTVPASPDGKLPGSLQEIQSGYIDALRKANVEKGEKFVELTERYVAALDRLMRSLAAQDKLDLSLNAKTEKQRAEFVLADVASQVNSLATSAPSATNLKEGLLLHYGFDVSEEKVVRDLSGNGKNGVAIGVVIEDDGVRGKCCRFNGKSTRVEIPRVHRSGPFSLAFFAKVSPDIRDLAGVFASEQLSGRAPRRAYIPSFQLQWDAKRKAVVLGKMEEPEIARLSASRWTHLAVTYDGRTLCTYADGKLNKRAEWDFPAQMRRPALGVSRNMGNRRFFRGCLDELMIWSRALSETEVKQVYELACGR